MSTYRYDKDINHVRSVFDKIHQKYKVTATELAFLGSFIINFIVGKLIHFTSQKEEVYNYYNDKNNILNQLFVKKGWFWTTLVIVIFYGSILIKGHPKVNNNKGKIIQSATVKYIISTVWWILFTQWCFGLPIMDRIFLYTGGKCITAEEKNIIKHLPFFTRNEEENIFESTLIGSGDCRRLKGQWIGGHDPSGHAFLLIHSSLYLFFEIIPFWYSWKVTVDNFNKIVCEVKSNDITTIDKIKKIAGFIISNPWIIVSSLISLWWFMLLMTNIYFHSILEKFVGLLFGYVICIAYLTPRFM